MSRPYGRRLRPEMSTREPLTCWRIRGLEGLGRLDILLVCDTTAPQVINAIETAAERNGIELERDEQTEQSWRLEGSAE